MREGEDDELVGSAEKGKRKKKKKKTPLAPRWGLREGEEEDVELVGSVKTTKRQTPHTSFWGLHEDEEELAGSSKEKRNRQTPLALCWINFSPQ